MHTPEVTSSTITSLITESFSADVVAIATPK